MNKKVFGPEKYDLILTTMLIFIVGLLLFYFG